MGKFANAFLFIMVLAAFLSACQSESNQQAATNQPATAEIRASMKATIQRQLNLPDIASASGMEVIGDKVYIVGDDSPYLYVLNLATLKQQEKINLFETSTFGTGRIPKALKPDLECLTVIPINGQDHLIAFGSGSAPTRANAYTIPLQTKNNAAPGVREYSLLKLYQALQADKELLRGDRLNVEAAATTKNQLLLLQRSVHSGPNLLLAFSLPAFTAYFTGKQQDLPAYQAIPFRLPQLSGLDSHFSGASVFGNRLFVTASVENTSDAILDGEVLGSFVGWIDLDAVKATDKPLELQTALVLNSDGNHFAGKVESLVVTGILGPRRYRALAITDNDNGQSDLLELELELVF